MADGFGGRLLREIQTESLSELLLTLSSRLPISDNPTLPGIPFLRDILRLHTQGTYPGLSTHYHSNQDQSENDNRDAGIPSSPSPGPEAGPRLSPGSSPLNIPRASTASDFQFRYSKPPLIEITSLSTSNIRTRVLCHTIASLLSPDNSSLAPDGIVILFDSALKISLSIRLLQRQLLHFHKGDHTTTQNALARLHIIKQAPSPDSNSDSVASSSRETLAQLRQIDAYIRSLDTPHVSIAGIILADLSAWYWTERWDEELLKMEVKSEPSVPAAEKAPKTYSRESKHAMLVTEVLRLQKTWRCVVIVSGLGTGSLDSVRSGLAAPWGKVVDVRVVLHGQQRRIFEGSEDVGTEMMMSVDARKWLATCGVVVSGAAGSMASGRASCRVKTTRERLEMSDFELEHA